MPTLRKAGRMLRWGVLPMAAALVLALGASPAAANGKHDNRWGHGGGWNKHAHWQPRAYYPNSRYNYNRYYYYRPAPRYYYPPPVYYYPRERYYYGHGYDQPRFRVILPFDFD